ncbi:hypothetical protein [Anaerophilus nitritogenes]|uniref:hypothetical protein n=1 Tax=Anaerophilus nitritogenes TaxID=2498136 RepID=UPI00101B7F67|nr:hypothetical protein [Anaerophilus nitritogenes]
MKHTKQRISKIVDEMLNYFFLIGATDIEVHLKDEEEFYKIFLKSNYTKGQENRIEELIRYLEAPKQEEMEEYYWELAGACDMDTELTLIGMMIDKGEVNFTQDKIELTLYKKK